MSDKEKNQVEDRTRRTFLRNSGFALGGIVIGGTVGSLLGTTDTKNESNVNTESGAPVANPNVALMFFYPEEYETTMAAAERIFPKNDLGPGAMELNAGIYIDHQLASQWGVNARDYTDGPFYKPEPTQGEQIKVLRKDLFRLGLKGLDNYSNENYQTNFADLEAAEQDEVLTAFEKGEGPSLSGVSTSDFFKLLRQLTIEGIYADPLYGGNKEMLGWQMRKYPGTYMSYVKEIKSDEFVELDQQSLHSHMGHS
ncbi:gluconate 2-dehydrogenase subunit 3 family protein [Virgibacillus indicus]|nr:gluconate 2-dehydrogenase subunit 3 family protein [Virgibacillus indicus]